MSFVNGIWYVFITTMKLTVVSMLIANAFDLLPKNVTFTQYHVKDPLPLTGKLAVNNLLDNAERLFQDEIKGPEGLAVLDGELYTTLQGGFVAKVVGNKVIPIVRFGERCRYFWEEERCGRPLGLATTLDGHLIVADAYLGIFKLNPKTSEYVSLVSKDVEIDGVVPKIFNDVTVAKDGTIYWTHSSSDFNLCDGLYTMLCDPSGRLIKYDPVKKENQVLLNRVHFANGVALSKNEDFLVISETAKSRIIRLYLKGRKRGQTEIFIDGLPGVPDGLRPNGKGGFLVSLNVAKDEANPFVIDFLAPMPFLRRTIARFFAFSDWSFVQMYNFYPNKLSRRLGYIIGHFEMFSLFYPGRTTVIELQENGQISASFHGMDGSVRGISDVIVHKGYLYMGSPYNTYLARISLAKLKNKFVDTGERLK